MMHNFDGHYFGMHYMWWIIWMFLLIWIFILPYNIPFQRSPKESPLDILKKRFAKGEISKEEFEEAKRVIKSDK